MHGPNPVAQSPGSQSSAVVVAVVVCEVVTVVVGVVVVVVVALVVCVVVGVVESQRPKPDGQSLLSSLNGRHWDSELWQTPAVPVAQPSQSATSSSSRHRLKLSGHVLAVTFLYDQPQGVEQRHGAWGRWISQHACLPQAMAEDDCKVASARASIERRRRMKVGILTQRPRRTPRRPRCTGPPPGCIRPRSALLWGWRSD